MQEGDEFIKEALSKGAKALVIEDYKKRAEGVTNIVVSDSRQTLAYVSAQFYGHPSLELKVIGVTGTNGKTTTSFLLESIFKEARERPGIIGTIEYRFAEKVWVPSNTTPESLDLQKILRDMVKDKVSHAILEVSSHAVAQRRIEKTHFDVAIFTNLTPEHLDYHQTMANYLKTKERLFSQYLAKSLKKKRYAILNLDDPQGKVLASKVTYPILFYGIRKKGEIYPQGFISSPEGIRAKINTPMGSFEIHSPLLGEFNLYNILAAVGGAITQEIPISIIQRGVERLKGVPGRLEPIKNAHGLTLLVDYAHTPDGLSQVLNTLSALAPKGRIITAFGCGGNRDKGKRPLMGKISSRHSHLTIVTSDNPRGEDPLQIMGEIEEGIKEEGGRYLMISSRSEAIKRAINLAHKGDIVLIAGKGHEAYQIIGGERIPFDDRKEAKKALEEKWRNSNSPWMTY